MEKKSKNFKFKNLVKKIEFIDFSEIADLKKSLIYMSGPREFINYAAGILKAGGLFSHQFKFEENYPDNPEINGELYKYFEEGRPKVFKDELLETKIRAQLSFDLINSSASHTVVTDTNGRIIFANEAAQRITGFSFSEMKNQTPRLWGGMMSKEFYEALWQAKRRGEVSDSEVINRRKNGELYVAKAHISPIKNEKKEIIGYIGSEEDITSIFVAEQKAAENENKFIELVARIPEVYWIIDLKPVFKISFVSPAFEKIWGVTPEQLYENNDLWIEKVHPDDRKKAMSDFDEFKNSGKSFNLEYRVLSATGEVFTVLDQGGVVRDEKGAIIRLVGVARDITKEKEVDKAKTEFVSLASHQLKTPISAISWDAEMLIAGDYGIMDEKQKNIVEQIYSTNNRMKDLVNGLLNVSRIDMGTFIIEPTPVDLTKIADDVLKEMEGKLTVKKHEIIKNYPAKAQEFLGDPNLLRIVFQNYISNAIKYTPDKGKVTISIIFSDQSVLVSVANNGEAIPEAEQEKIFQKLYRASNANQQDPDGNGLGLYLVKAIANASGGKVWFESKSGSNTIFYISFPIFGMKSKIGSKQLT